MYITVITQTRGKKHFRRITLEELVEAIRSGQYEKQISELRQLYSALHTYTDNDGKTQGMDNLTERIPEVCFAAEYDHYQNNIWEWMKSSNYFNTTSLLLCQAAIQALKWDGCSVAWDIR
jgi:hypothetical protein